MEEVVSDSKESVHMVRKVIQPLLTFIRWVICHTDSGRKFTRFYKTTCDNRRRHEACMRLQRYGWEILERVDIALKNADSGYFVDYGTLLGLVREKGFIRHDDDIDFSLPYGRLSAKDLLEIMLKNGFKFMRAFVWRGNVTEITFLYKRIEVDFFYVFREKGGPNFSLIYDLFSVEGEEHVARKITRLEKPDVMDVALMGIQGMKVPIPCAVTEFLQYSYGSNWNTPVKNYRSDDHLHRRILEGSARMFVTLNEFTSYLSA